MTRYAGGCHCGAVRFEINLDLDHLVACNCSYCSKRGHLMAFAEEAGFTLLSHESELSDYQFNRKAIHHLFCRSCGIESFGRGIRPDGTPMVMINARCLDDLDIESLPVTPFDGRSKP